MQATWIIVADSSSARFFSTADPQLPLDEFDALIHAEGRIAEHDALCDRQGGIAGGHGEGDHAFEARTDFKHHEAQVFARQIGDRLEQGRVNHSYQQLILVAPPAFLGVLRQTLNDQVLKMLSASLDKHLVDQTEAVIRQHIF